MRIGIHVGHWEGRPHDVAELAVEAERAGFDSVWTSETWGSDGTVLLAWIAAHTDRIGLGAGVLQMPARSPAAAAMAALTLDHLSGGRFRLGLGVSGPQVGEGWHGAPFDGPIARTREYVDIVRSVLRREAPVTAPGPNYPLPLSGGAGKALKPNVRPLRSDLPIPLAAMGPRNVALAAEIADGWIPFLFSPERPAAFEDAVADGSSRRAPGLADLDVAPMVPVALGPDLGTCRDELRPLLALYAGGMGSAGRELLQGPRDPLWVRRARERDPVGVPRRSPDRGGRPRPRRDDRRALSGRLGRARPRPPRRLAVGGRHHPAREGSRRPNGSGARRSGRVTDRTGAGQVAGVPRVLLG